MFSSNLIFESSAGNPECEENELDGELLTNDTKNDQGTFNEGRFEGDFDAIPGACKTSATGPVLIAASGFPWPIQFLPAKKALKFKGSKKLEFTISFLALEGPDNKCTFETPRMAGTFNVSLTKEPVTVTTTKVTYKHSKHAPDQTALCPASAVLSFTGILHSGAETVESQLTS
jgi:hypothetical protein